MGEDYNIESVNAQGLFEQKKAEMMKEEHFLKFEVVIGGSDAIIDYNADKAEIDQVLMLYRILKDKMKELNEAVPIIEALCNLVETDSAVEIEYNGDEDKWDKI